MKKGFIELTGIFIHHCGVLEFLINNSIKKFAKDQLLASDAISSPLHKRINLLRKLLKQRSGIENDFIVSLCNDIDEIRLKRNIVAHNPIVSTKPDETGEEEILVIRHKPSEVTVPDKLTKKDISELVNKTKNLIQNFTRMIPDSTQT
jgi:hypothetical protein